MCIDIFRFGESLDIPYLLEQVWFDINRRKPRKLDVTEVYDILLRNPKGSDPLTEVWALFPHNCAAKKQIVPVRVTPPSQDQDKPDPNEKYDWPFKGLPRPGNTRESVIRDCVVECPDTFGDETEPLEGRTIRIEHIDFPNIREALDAEKEKTVGDVNLESYSEILAKPDVRKTLVRFSFPDTPLSECETGWLRLIVKPGKMDTMSVKARMLPGIVDDEKSNDYVLDYTQRLDVFCPLVLRDILFKKLDGKESPAEKLQDFLDRLNYGGTSTRIWDHRIALVVSKKNMDIYDTICTTKGVYYYGMLDLKSRRRHAFLWGCGSRRNPEDDLIHNAMRVIDRLLLFPPEPAERLAAALAPSGKYEAFSLLINLMIETDLLVKVGGDTLKVNTQREYNYKHMPQDTEFDFRKIRNIYATESVESQDIALVREFRDLHPFRISFRAVWEKHSEKTKKLFHDLIRWNEGRKNGQMGDLA